MSKRSSKSLQVTLSFGSHSPSDLVRTLRQMRPYARAKLAHQLIREGYRSRLRSFGFGDGTPTPRPDLVPDAPKRQSTPSSVAEAAHISVPTEAEAAHDADADSVLDQLGKTVQ